MIRALRDALRRRAVRRWVDSLPLGYGVPGEWVYTGGFLDNRCRLHAEWGSDANPWRPLKPHVRYIVR